LQKFESSFRFRRARPIVRGSIAACALAHSPDQPVRTIDCTNTRFYLMNITVKFTHAMRKPASNSYFFTCVPRIS